MSTISKRIDKCRNPGQKFWDKFLTIGTDKMTNAQQIPRRGMGTLGTDWAIMYALSYIDFPVWKW